MGEDWYGASALLYYSNPSSFPIRLTLHVRAVSLQILFFTYVRTCVFPTNLILHVRTYSPCSGNMLGLIRGGTGMGHRHFFIIQTLAVSLQILFFTTFPSLSSSHTSLLLPYTLPEYIVVLTLFLQQCPATYIYTMYFVCHDVLVYIL